ncbi:MAG: restriction endonuclease subunit S [Mucispirillum sp.]|nr:restriction endonuclease subunit S [Mucispirillum sp.]
MNINKIKMITAEEYCIRVFDGTHDSPKRAENGYKLLTSKNIVDGKLKKDDAYFISEKDYIKVNMRSQIQQWDILFSMIGSVGNICLIDDKQIDYAIKNIGVFSTMDEYKAKWLYIYLISPLAKKYISRYLSGAVQKYIPLEILRKFPVVPFENKFIKFIDFFWNINNNIEYNNKLNMEIETLAKTLYNYWFVQFDFPDENGRPYKSSGGKMVYNEELKKEIPEGWEVKKCKDILDVITGNEDVNFTSENGIYPFFSCSKQVFKCDKYAFDGLAILIAGNGDFNVKAYKGKFNAYQRTYVLMPNDENYFAILYLSALNTINKFKVGANGAIIKFIRKKDIENIPLVIPNNKNLLKILNDLLYYQLHINNYNQELTSLRDFLLPLLMNGQAVISD